MSFDDSGWKSKPTIEGAGVHLKRALRWTSGAFLNMSMCLLESLSN
jgi:hypothetical protein